MGKISDFNLTEYISKYGIKTLVETGAGTGTGIAYVLNFPFEEIYSCDIDTEQVFKLNETFKAHLGRLTILPVNSEAFLSILLQEENIHNQESILFFLDAHFPSADLGKRPYDDEKNLDIRIPLERELDIIQKYRKGRKDVIIIDDWRIYEKMDFHGGDLEAIGYGNITAYNHSNFLVKWENTHNVEKILQDTGYILMTPK